MEAYTLSRERHRPSSLVLFLLGSADRRTFLLRTRDERYKTISTETGFFGVFFLFFIAVGFTSPEGETN